MNASIHGHNIQQTNKKQHHIPQPQHSTQQKLRIYGLRFDTGADQTFIFTLQKYREYSQAFKLLQSMKSIVNPSKSGIRGRSKAVGALVIQVPFKQFKIVIGV